MLWAIEHKIIYRQHRTLLHIYRYKCNRIICRSAKRRRSSFRQAHHRHRIPHRLICVWRILHALAHIRCQIIINQKDNIRHHQLQHATHQISSFLCRDKQLFFYRLAYFMYKNTQPILLGNILHLNDWWDEWRTQKVVQKSIFNSGSRMNWYLIVDGFDAMQSIFYAFWKKYSKFKILYILIGRVKTLNMFLWMSKFVFIYFLFCGSHMVSYIHTNTLNKCAISINLMFCSS